MTILAAAVNNNRSMLAPSSPASPPSLSTTTASNNNNASPKSNPNNNNSSSSSIPLNPSLTPPNINNNASLNNSNHNNNNNNNSNASVCQKCQTFVINIKDEVVSSADVVFSNKLTWLLVLGPVAIVGQATNTLGEAACFFGSGIALIPCAERLSFITEQVAAHTNGTIGALLNATFGNAPELLISVAALRQGYVRVVQLAMLGSMLTNLMLVFGLSCFIGGCRWQVQTLRQTSGNVPVVLLYVAVCASLFPAALKVSGQFQKDDSNNNQDDQSQDGNDNYFDPNVVTPQEVAFSRVNAIVLLVLYFCFLLFQLATHKDEFEENAEPAVGSMASATSHRRAKRNWACWKFGQQMRLCAMAILSRCLPTAIMNRIQSAWPGGRPTSMRRAGLKRSRSARTQKNLPKMRPRTNSSSRRRQRVANGTSSVGDEEDVLSWANRVVEDASPGNKNAPIAANNLMMNGEYHAGSEDSTASGGIQRRHYNKNNNGGETNQLIVELPVLNHSHKRASNKSKMSDGPPDYYDDEETNNDLEAVHSDDPLSPTHGGTNSNRTKRSPQSPSHQRSGSGGLIVAGGASTGGSIEEFDDEIDHNREVGGEEEDDEEEYYEHEYQPDLDGNDEFVDEGQEEKEEPVISMRVGIVWLFLITVCISAMSDILVDTIDGFAHRLHLSQVFTSMVIIPFFSNVAEQVSAFLFAYRNEMDLTVGVTVGSACQIASMVLPGSVLLGQWYDADMTLFFGAYETVCLLISVVVVGAVLQGGTTNWMTGIMLVGIYAMLAAGIWFHEIEYLTDEDDMDVGTSATAAANSTST